ncbi:MAG: sulfate/thiosulfate import ATP-binding protein CysA [Bacteroidota bacterium]
MISCQIKKQLFDAQGIMPLEMDFTINSGERVALYGSSGAGKTSVLRMLAGLMKPDSGAIEVGGASWFDSDRKFHLNPGKRGLGFVFQDYALFPNMTVLENLEFAQGPDKSGMILQELLDVMELGELRNSKPGSLSGGQQQRAALARALAGNPDILLLDEPFTALHAEMRIRLSEYLLQIHKKSNLTVILITHELGDIFRICDRVMVLERGKIINNGTPETVFLGDSSKSELRMHGIVLRIVDEGQKGRVSVQLQSEIHEIEVDQDRINSFSVGDEVYFSFNLENSGQLHLRPYPNNYKNSV